MASSTWESMLDTRLHNGRLLVPRTILGQIREVGPLSTFQLPA